MPFLWHQAFGIIRILSLKISAEKYLPCYNPATWCRLKCEVRENSVQTVPGQVLISDKSDQDCAFVKNWEENFCCEIIVLTLSIV